MKSWGPGMPPKNSAQGAHEAQQARYRVVVRHHLVMQGNALIDAALECCRIGGVTMLVIGIYGLAAPSIWWSMLLIGAPQLFGSVVLLLRLGWHRFATWRAVRAYAKYIR